MAHTNNWDETSPTNATVAVNIDDEIRKLRLDARERLALDHDFASSDLAADTRGVHTKVTFKEKIASPTVSGTQSCLYAKTGDGDSELRYKCVHGVDHAIVFVGEVRMYFGTTAPAGWLFLGGETVGDAACGGDYADAKYEEVFTLLWNNTADAQCPVTPGGRGVSAAADFAAHKKIKLPDFRSRMPIGYGAGSGLTMRDMAGSGGAEIADVSHTHNVIGNTDVDPVEDGEEGTGAPSSGPGHIHPISIVSASGGSATQAIMNPFMGIAFIIKY